MALQEEFEKRGNWLFRYRGILPLIVLFAGFSIYLWSKVNPSANFLWEARNVKLIESLFLVISLTGLIMRIYTIGHTFKNTSGRNIKTQVADTLNTTGIYSLVRHPLYVGNFFMWLGPILLTGHIWFILVMCLAYWIYYERIMFAEEQFLRRKFGAQYLEWAGTVPPFVPRFRGFVKPENPFNWKKVWYREKNGLAAVFLIFTLFDVAGQLIVNERDFNYFFAAGLLISVLNYLVLKLLKNANKSRKGVQQ